MNLKWRQIGLVIMVLAVGGAAGCASSPQPFDYHDDRDEKPGPGLFSGEDGGYIISSEPKEQNAEAEKTPTDTD
jgi:hypothetical protein